MSGELEFKFECPACGQRILAAAQSSGSVINCPSCQARMTIPSPFVAQTSEAASLPARTGQTIRIELPRTAGGGGHVGFNPDPVGGTPPKPPEKVGKAIKDESWPDLVQRLEHGAQIAPAELATALFQELIEVRRRLDQLERRLEAKA